MCMRIFIALDLDQIQTAPVTIYFNQCPMTLSRKELEKFIVELEWARDSIKNIESNPVYKTYMEVKNGE